jgi:hypothetical protein
VRITVMHVWLGLLAATCLSWALGTSGATGSRRELGGAVILTVAFVKVRFVGHWFMELRGAPTVLRRLFDGWCVLVSVLLIVMLMVGSRT